MTTEPTPDAPELPELPDSVNVGDKHNCTIWAYTADQMREMYQRGLAARPLPSDWVAVPARLTAENGAKAALMGEFHERSFHTCEGCDGEGYDDSGDACEVCDGSCSVEQKVTVSWDNIKAIHRAVVEHFGVQAAPSAPAEGGELAMAQRLAVSLWQQHYSEEAPNWTVDDTLTGVLLQISNMTSGMKTAPEPLAQGGGREAVDRDAWAEALELPQGYTVDEFLPGGWHYAWTRADGERMVSGTTWNHPALAAIAAWQYASDTPPQPSASVSERARELLAAEYDNEGVHGLAESIRAGTFTTHLDQCSINAITNALASAPDGFALVPVEPTEAMKDAGDYSKWNYDDAADIYKAMLRAAGYAARGTKEPVFALEQALTQQRGEPVASICLVTDRRLPHFAAAEIQLYDGYEPKIGDKLYTTPQPSADAVRELVQRWRAEPDGHYDYDQGHAHGKRDCADELESLLGRGG